MNELTSIVKPNRKWGEKLRVPWYFERWYEKGALIFLAVCFVYSFMRIVFQGFW